MEFLISWNENDLVRLFETHPVLRRKNATLIWKAKPVPSIGILCPREDLEAIIMERIRVEGFKPAEGAVITWRVHKGITAQIKVIGDPAASKPQTETTTPPAPTSVPVPPVELDPSLFPPGTDIAALQAAQAAAQEQDEDVLSHPITGEVVGTTKDRTKMRGETSTEEKPDAQKTKPKKPKPRKKKSRVPGGKRRKRS